jgi:hypothetical protein
VLLLLLLHFFIVVVVAVVVVAKVVAVNGVAITAARHIAACHRALRRRHNLVLADAVLDTPSLLTKYGVELSFWIRGQLAATAEKLHSGFLQTPAHDDEAHALFVLCLLLVVLLCTTSGSSEVTRRVCM